MRPKILVLRLSSMGDILLTTSVIDPLQQAGFSLVYVTKTSFVDLLESIPGVSVYPFEKGTDEKRARDAFFAWAEEQNFVGVLDLHDSWRTWLWRRRLKKLAPVVVSRKRRLRELAVIFLRLGHFWGWRRGGRALDYRLSALELIRVLGKSAPGETRLTRLGIDADKAKSAAKTWGKDFYVLVPGSAWAGKRWPAENFLSLARMLKKDGRVLVLGAAADEECNRIAHEAQVEAVLGKSLAEVKYILLHATHVVGNDTGLVHIAQALGVPCTMIEGPTHPYLGFSLYEDPKANVVGLDLLCRPCSKTGRICLRGGTRRCLRGISGEKVYQIIKESP